MKMRVALILCLSVVFALGCEYEETIENAEFNIDGKDYKVEISEVQAPDENEITINTNEKGTTLPPSTKYAIVTPKEVYLTNTVLYKYTDMITIVNYSIKENGVWVFYEKTLNLHKEKDGPLKVEQLKI